MWKNIIALGLASLCVCGVNWSVCRAQFIDDKSLAPSGVNGLSIMFIEAGQMLEDM